MEERLSHPVIRPIAYRPSDIAWGDLGGVVCDANTRCRVAWMVSDPAVAGGLCIEAVPSQSSLSRFFGVLSQRTATDLGRLQFWAMGRQPSLRTPIPSHNAGYRPKTSQVGTALQAVRHRRHWRFRRKQPYPRSIPENAKSERCDWISRAGYVFFRQSVIVRS